MFDLTSSKLLLLGIVALLVVGPKDLPILLRTVGKYVGMIKRQAAEFRAQFDEAMRESEIDQLKKEVEGLGREAETAVREAGSSVESEMARAEREVDGALRATEGGAATADAGALDAHDANGLPIAAPPDLASVSKPLDTTGAAAPAAEKTGA